MDAVHRLVLEGRAPALGRHFPSVGGDATAGDPWPPFRETVAEHRGELRELIPRPMQLNDVGRSAALIGGFLHAARATGLPIRELELGASAGLNLHWDRYWYVSDGATWGNPESPVHLGGAFLGGRPPFEVAARVAGRGGCDTNPLDPDSEDDRLTLMSHIWPDQRERMELLRAALGVARTTPVKVDRADAPVWLALQLAERASGVVTVVFHSYVMGYLGDRGRARVRSVLEHAGRRASSEAPLAWLRMEGDSVWPEVQLTVWPPGNTQLLARAHNQGAVVHWLAD